MVDVVNSHLLVINFLPPERKLISNAVGEGQRLGDPESGGRSELSEGNSITTSISAFVFGSDTLTAATDGQQRICLDSQQKMI